MQTEIKQDGISLFYSHALNYGYGEHKFRLEQPTPNVLKFIRENEKEDFFTMENLENGKGRIYYQCTGSSGLNDFEKPFTCAGDAFSNFKNWIRNLYQGERFNQAKPTQDIQQEK